MLKNVEIRNFRCFQKAVLAPLSRYNIIVGDNSSGKTALLEALFLMSSSNPELSLRNNIWRGVSNSKAEFTAQYFKSLWKDMFYSLDEDARISIAGKEQVGRNYRKLEVYLDKTAVSRPVKVEEDPSLIESIRPINFHVDPRQEQPECREDRHRRRRKHACERDSTRVSGGISLSIESASTRRHSPIRRPSKEKAATRA